MASKQSFDGIALSAARPRNAQQLVPLLEELPTGIRSAIDRVELLADGSIKVTTRNAHTRDTVAYVVSSALVSIAGQHGRLQVGKGDQITQVPASVPVHQVGPSAGAILARYGEA